MTGVRYKLSQLNHDIEQRMAASGYQDNDSWLECCVDRAIVAVILLITAPVSIILAVLIKLQDGGPIFYKGLRYGLGKKEFNMYKFRTLVPDAESKIGARLLKPGMGFETPIGSFLRDTRLDELPQLINVFKGDMALIGPRPERPVVYEKMCRDIPGYDLRFKVKPGVIGYSQLFTPHSASKRMRAKIDNFYIKRSPNVNNNIIFVIYSMIFLGLSAIKKTALVVYKKVAIYYSVYRFTDLRQFTRVKYLLSYQARLLLSFNRPDSKEGRFGYNEQSVDPRVTTFIFDINDKFVSVITDYPLPELNSGRSAVAKLIVHAQARMLDRRKNRFIAFCRITSIKESVSRTGYHNTYRYLLGYEPTSAYQQYKIDKYILNKSIL